MSLRDQTLFITGASRGIGLAIALRAARDGANVVVAAKTAEPHPKLPGTIHTAAAEIEAAGGRALPVVVDVRDEGSVARAVEQAVARFGGIDVLVNNASAISLTGTLATPPRIFDRMMSVNTRGTFVASQACLPHLKRSKNPHVLNLSPPLNMDPRWFAPHVAYTMAKYGMSLCVLGMAREFERDGIAVNALWPRTAIATAAIEFAIGDASSLRHCRKPEIMADAAHWILTQPSRSLTGRFLIDDEVLGAAGVTDFDAYAVSPGAPLALDFFLDDAGPYISETVPLAGGGH
ncbi:MAG: NAD(P)-dependent oxidoreductase [Lysobacterales bacterium]|jgi:citronellol/citronellal dehydrogenase|nr:MAG: NAD(P)-dependent oxidoreductase [Xanthomonadales bacterium]